jgi:hypothetical protein
MSEPGVVGWFLIGAFAATFFSSGRHSFESATNAALTPVVLRQPPEDGHQ